VCATGDTRWESEKIILIYRQMECPCCLKKVFTNKTFLSSKYGNRSIICCDYCSHNIDLTTYNNTDVNQGGVPDYRKKNKKALTDFMIRKGIFLKRLLQHLKNLGMKKEPNQINFMDFGCGGGEVVYAGKDIFKISHGLNLNTDFYRTNLSLLEIEDSHISNLVFDSIEKTDKTYDIVLSWHVLEHFKNPQEFVDIIKKLLTPLNGYLCIQVPTLVDRGISSNHYHYFNDKSIKILFENNGFYSIRCSYDEKTSHLTYIAKSSPPEITM
jgi:SAM-dependent methyltransferase